MAELMDNLAFRTSLQVRLSMAMSDGTRICINACLCAGGVPKIWQKIGYQAYNGSEHSLGPMTHVNEEIGHLGFAQT